MTRLLVHVEGQTEESFVNELLRGHLCERGFASVSARLIGNARQRGRRGGISGWSAVKKDIVRHLKEDTGCIATTMVDYYGLPHAGDKAWPGRAEAISLAMADRAPAVETAILNDLNSEMGAGFDSGRFVPFVVMHEFEGLLFSDCSDFANAIGHTGLAGQFQTIRDQFATPEEIDDSPHSAPSKRIEQLIPEYQKPSLGTLAALEIGLDKIRNACPHFQCWISRLEALAP